MGERQNGDWYWRDEVSQVAVFEQPQIGPEKTEYWATEVAVDWEPGLRLLEQEMGLRWPEWERPPAAR